MGCARHAHHRVIEGTRWPEVDVHDQEVRRADLAYGRVAQGVDGVGVLLGRAVGLRTCTRPRPRPRLHRHLRVDRQQAHVRPHQRGAADRALQVVGRSAQHRRHDRPPPPARALGEVAQTRGVRLCDQSEIEVLGRRGRRRRRPAEGFIALATCRLIRLGGVAGTKSSALAGALAGGAIDGAIGGGGQP